jgi:tryptophan-rich hypothetical protein
MNRINPRKLLLSKWTAANPCGREKHFIVSRVVDDANGNPETCELEAVYSKRVQELHWRELRDSDHWRQGWL